VHVRDSRHATKLFDVILDREWILLWTQLRHLSHMDCKTKAKSGVGKAAARGDTGRFDGLGGQRHIRHILAHCLLSVI
jgi:hypothetical protein